MSITTTAIKTMAPAAAALGLAALMFGAMAPHGHAGEMKISGTATYTVHPISNRKLANGNSLSVSALKTVLIGTGEGNPFHGALQDCIGSSLRGVNGGEIESIGTCVATDGDGDVWWLTYRNTPSARDWTVVGGTGKFAGASGSGTTVIIAGGKDRFAIRWDGTANMKK